ncbi:tripartite tricarboxylate transporter TctB family protein [Halomonas sp. C05BenzN]|uniref:tripartite tricarboxylate transporter TctB family protein n=1 Tax=Halomonas sp. C05BenzN TaxID=3411041 RepID=UPI003B95E825
MTDTPRQPRSPGDRVHSGDARAKALGHVVFNGLLALLFTLMFVRAGDLPSSMWEPMGSGTFPRLILGVLLLFNLTIIIQELRRYLGCRSIEPHAVRGWLWQHRLAFSVLGLFALFTLAVPVIGFRWASFPFLVASQCLLGARRPKAVLIALVVALVMSFGLDALFRHVFTISLPRGMWG